MLFGVFVSSFTVLKQSLNKKRVVKGNQNHKKVKTPYDFPNSFFVRKNSTPFLNLSFAIVVFKFKFRGTGTCAFFRTKLPIDPYENRPRASNSLNYFSQ
jgi:hypothetical protein